MPLTPLVEPAADLTVQERLRYSRHLLLPEVGRVGQLRLKNARVLVVGAGGLGSPALLYLAAAGVGTIGVVDDDLVDASNLQRQVVHGQDDVGRPKVDSAADRITAVNPLVEVVRHRLRLDAGNVLDVLAGYDLVLDGADNFPTRYLVNDACVLLGIPDVWGSVFRFDGQAAVFWPSRRDADDAANADDAARADAPCYRCLHPQAPPPGAVPSCAEGGVLGVLCAAVGAVQATEAVKLITGIGEPLLGRLVVHDALAGQQQVLTVRRDPDCAVCGTSPTITTPEDLAWACGSTDAAERAQRPSGSAQALPQAADDVPVPAVTARQLKAMLDAGEDLLVVDVREPVEHELGALPGAVLVPRGEILSGAALPGLPRDVPLVLHCRSGVRSAQALVALREAGFRDVRHLEGGVLAWARDVDPTLPTG